MVTNRIYEDSAYIGDFGYPITLDTEINITSADEVKIIVIKPDEDSTEDSWIGSVVDDTKVQHFLEDGELDIKGTYLLHAFAKKAASWQRMGTLFKLNVLKKGE